MCRLIETPLLRDMRQTARQLGIVADLIALRDCCGREACDECRQRINNALEMLGVHAPTIPRSPLPADPRD